MCCGCACVYRPYSFSPKTRTLLQQQEEEKKEGEERMLLARWLVETKGADPCVRDRLKGETPGEAAMRVGKGALAAYLLPLAAAALARAAAAEEEEEQGL